MATRKKVNREPEVDEILNDPKLLDEWTGRVVKGWRKIGRSYSKSSKA